MSARTATATKSPQKAQRELEDLQLVLKARNGSQGALDQLLRRYHGFVRLKASSYFLAGGDGDDLIQEGMIGLYKAVRDFRPDKETSFRSFAELCVTRQIITAIKSATRFKHAPLNQYVSFSHTPAGQDGDGDCTLGDALPGPGSRRPVHAASSRPRSSSRSSAASARALLARVRGAAALPRRPLVRADGGGARLRLQDDRQRAPAGEAEDRGAPDHAGRRRIGIPRSASVGAVTTPLDRSSTWPYVDGEPDRFSYARAEHPTQVACEEALGALDGGHALLYPSGMGAVTTAFLTLLAPGRSSRSLKGRTTGTSSSSTISASGGSRSSSSIRPVRHPPMST